MICSINLTVAMTLPIKLTLNSQRSKLIWSYLQKWLVQSTWKKSVMNCLGYILMYSLDIRPWPSHHMWQWLSFQGNIRTWWCHSRETLSKLKALCKWNAPLTSGFHSQRAIKCHNMAMLSTLLVSVRRIHQLPVVSLHKRPINSKLWCFLWCQLNKLFNK